MSSSPPAAPAPSPAVAYPIWRARVEAELGGEAQRLLSRTTLDGLDVEPLYAADHPDADPDAVVPLPRLPSRSGAWRIWQELPVSAGAAGRTALARERERGL